MKKYDYDGQELNTRAAIDTYGIDIDDDVIIDIEPADSWPGCGRGVQIRETDAGAPYIAVDLGNDTQYFRAWEDEQGCIADERDLLSFLVGEDEDMVAQASVHGSDVIREADPDTTEPCRIIMEHQWYGPNTTYGWYSEDARGHEWEGTWEQAQAIIDDLEDGTYYLQHNESGRPTYYIVEA